MCMRKKNRRSDFAEGCRRGIVRQTANCSACRAAALADRIEEGEPMISERDVAQLCLDIYQGQPAQWDQLEAPPDGVAFGIKEYPEGIALIFRGSVTLQEAISRRPRTPHRTADWGRCIQVSSPGFLNYGRGLSRD